MSENMVERVAAVLRQELDHYSNFGEGVFEDVARAAISAMREPTEEMSGTVYFKGDDISASAVWREMIDRALGQT
jgi:hypothetical protein